MEALLRPGLLIVVLFALGACSSHGPRPMAPDASPQAHERTKPVRIPLSDSRRVHAELMAHYREWRGVPYRLGGQSKRGIDCSAFVQLAYRQRFGLNLPRTTARQATMGRQVKRKHLKTGDLVFFKTGLRVRHVGIYLGQQRFLHASTSRGVMISRLGQRYWARHFWKAVRL